jgi:hypothetical protein
VAGHAGSWTLLGAGLLLTSSFLSGDNPFFGGNVADTGEGLSYDCPSPWAMWTRTGFVDIYPHEEYGTLRDEDEYGRLTNGPGSYRACVGKNRERAAWAGGALVIGIGAAALRRRKESSARNDTDEDEDIAEATDED